MMGTVEAQRIAGLQQQQTGTLEWDQRPRQSYQPGTALPMALRVANPTDAGREYRLYLGLYDPQTRQLIPGTLEVVPVDGQQSFIVPARSSVQLQGDVTLDRTNVILALSLYDVVADAVVAQVATLLEGAAPPPGGDGGLGGVFTFIVPLLGLGLVFGVMGPMIKGLGKGLKGEGD
jgi:hypothetical protein